MYRQHLLILTLSFSLIACHSDNRDGAHTSVFGNSKNQTIKVELRLVATNTGYIQDAPGQLKGPIKEEVDGLLASMSRELLKDNWSYVEMSLTFSLNRLMGREIIKGVNIKSVQIVR